MYVNYGFVKKFPVGIKNGSKYKECIEAESFALLLKASKERESERGKEREGRKKEGKKYKYIPKRVSEKFRMQTSITGHFNKKPTKWITKSGKLNSGNRKSFLGMF